MGHASNLRQHEHESHPEEENALRLKTLPATSVSSVHIFRRARTVYTYEVLPMDSLVSTEDGLSDALASFYSGLKKPEEKTTTTPRKINAGTLVNQKAKSTRVLTSIWRSAFERNRKRTLERLLQDLGPHVVHRVPDW